MTDKPAEVVPLHGQPVEDVVEVLEQALDAAKSGSLRAVAIIGVIPSGRVATWRASDQSNAHRHELIAGTVYVQHELTKSAPVEDIE